MTVTTLPDQHAAGVTVEIEGAQVTPCSCGRRFTASTPTLSRARADRHVRESGPKIDTLPAPERIRVCGCGCAGSLSRRANGLFLSGHDARFKSILTTAHAAGQQVRHPQSGADTDALAVADWLDERRGGGTFWRDKVEAGHRAVPAPKKPVRTSTDVALSGAARADKLLADLAERRPAAGQDGLVSLNHGGTVRARVMKRENDSALRIKFLDGPREGEQIVILDRKFTKDN